MYTAIASVFTLNFTTGQNMGDSPNFKGCAKKLQLCQVGARKILCTRKSIEFQSITAKNQAQKPGQQVSETLLNPAIRFFCRAICAKQGAFLGRQLEKIFEQSSQRAKDFFLLASARNRFIPHNLEFRKI